MENQQNEPIQENVQATEVIPAQINAQANPSASQIEIDRDIDIDIEAELDWQALQEQITYTALDLIPQTVIEMQSEEEDESKISQGRSNENATKSKVISFRVTAEEYEQLHFQCLNEYGEKLLTVSKLAKLTALGLSKAKAMEQPLERYRLAIAAEIAMSMTDIVHKLDSGLEETENETYLSENGKIIIALENIQKKASMLLAPLVEQATQ